MTFTMPAATDTEFSGIPAGTYVVRLTTMEKHEREGDSNPKFKSTVNAYVKWVFTIEQVIDADVADDADPDDLIGQELWGFSSFTLGKKAKMRAWVEGVLGRSLQDREVPSVADLVGKLVKATIALEPGEERPRLKALSPYRPAKRKRRPAPEELEDSDDEMPF